MHVAGKVFLGLGVLFLVLGLVMANSGGKALEEVGDSFEDLDDFAIENANSGTVNVTDEDGKGDLGFTFWIEGEYLDEDGDGRWDHCAATNITILSHPEISDNEVFGEYARELNGSFYYEVNEWYDGCEADEENKNLDLKERGYVKVGRACLACYSGTLEFESNATVSVTYDDPFLEQLGAGLLALVGGTLGGSTCCCCGGFIAIIGLIMGLTMKSPPPATTMQPATGMVEQPAAEQTPGVVQQPPGQGGF